MNIPQVTPLVQELIKVLEAEMNRQEIQQKLYLLDRENFRSSYLKPALWSAVIEITIPEKLNSRLQKYCLTASGARLNFGEHKEKRAGLKILQNRLEII